MSAIQETWPGGVTLAMDATYTQANAAGGAIVVDISPGVGNEFWLMYARVVNSGTNGIIVDVLDADNDRVNQFANVASAAGTSVMLPSTGQTATGSANTTYSPRSIISGTDQLTFSQTGAGAQNDTFRILLRLRARFPPSGISISKARSTNQANVTVTAGSASFGVL